jgi:hypothetical protein
MKTVRADQSQQVQGSGAIDIGQRQQQKHPYILTLSVPDAMSFPPQTAIMYGQSRLAGTGVKLDRNFQIDGSHDPKAGTITYTYRVDGMTAAQAAKVRELGFTADKDEPVFIANGG